MLGWFSYMMTSYGFSAMCSDLTDLSKYLHSFDSFKNNFTWLCLHVGGIDRHLTVEQKTHGCVYTLVVWTSHCGTENTGMCLHVCGMDISQWNRKHMAVSTRWWYEHLTVGPKTQGCVGGMDRHLTVKQKTHGCVYTLVV